MAFDGITVACMAHELNKNLAGGRISKIAQPETDELNSQIPGREFPSAALCFRKPAPCLSDSEQQTKSSDCTEFLYAAPQTHQRWPHHFRYPAVSGTCTPF